MQARIRAARGRTRAGSLAAICLLIVAGQAGFPAWASDGVPVPTRFPVAVARSSPSAPPPRVQRSGQLWVWSWSAPGQLVDRARRSGLTELLVWVAPGFSRDAATMARLRVLVESARSAGITVYALGGDPSWAQTPARASAWATEVKASGLFAGVHVDIEPQSLPGWSADSTALARGLLTALAAMRSTGLPLEADIPIGYRTVLVDGRPLDQAVLAVVDGVTVMAYRDSATTVLAAARTELADAGRAGKPAHIGINIADPGSDGPATSFLGQTPADIQAAVDAIDAAARAWPAFAGVAVHDSTYLIRLDPAATLGFDGHPS